VNDIAAAERGRFLLCVRRAPRANSPATNGVSIDSSRA
jgi:hypothetical protein